jgi:hypothetical protein
MGARDERSQITLKVRQMVVIDGEKENNMSSSNGIGLAGIGTAFALFGLALAPVAGADPVIDPFEDLYGSAPWTVSADSYLGQDFYLGELLDGYAESVRLVGDPFTDLVGAIDPNAFPGDVPNPNDLLAVLAGTLDYSLDTIPVQLSTGGITVIEPLGQLIDSWLGIS